MDVAISAAATSHPAEPPPPCGDGEEGFESDKEDAPLDASVLERMPVHLVPLADIRPTQLAVGMQQVRGEGVPPLRYSEMHGLLHGPSHGPRHTLNGWGLTSGAGWEGGIIARRS